MNSVLRLQFSRVNKEHPKGMRKLLSHPTPSLSSLMWYTYSFTKSLTYMLFEFNSMAICSRLHQEPVEDYCSFQFLTSYLGWQEYSTHIWWIFVFKLMSPKVQWIQHHKMKCKLPKWKNQESQKRPIWCLLYLNLTSLWTLIHSAVLSINPPAGNPWERDTLLTYILVSITFKYIYPFFFSKECR